MTIYVVVITIICISWRFATAFFPVVYGLRAASSCTSSNLCRRNAVESSKDVNIDPASTEDGSGFIVDLTSEVTEEEISNQNLVKIVNLENSDLECNQLCWKCLGYKYDTETNTYSNENVFPKWREKYPEPPDVIGMKRVYSPDIDKPVRDASMALMRSIPRDFKGGVRALEKDGFKGFKLKELTPNKTRRAQLVNWLIFYREKLFNRSLDELLAEKEKEQPKSPEEAALPSEKNYQKMRVD